MPHHRSSANRIMNEKDQIDHLSNDLHNLIDRYKAEYELSLASVVGVLEVVKHQVIKQQLSNLDDED